MQDKLQERYMSGCFVMNVSFFVVSQAMSMLSSVVCLLAKNVRVLLFCGHGHQKLEKLL